MSQANVELVCAMLDSYNTGDMNTTMSYFAPHVAVFPDAAVFPEAGPLYGHEQFRNFLEEAGTAWVNAQWVITEVFALGDSRVICRGDWGGEGVASGIKLASGVTGIHTVCDGQISRIEYFFDHEQALKAAGLAE